MAFFLPLFPMCGAPSFQLSCGQIFPLKMWISGNPPEPTSPDVPGLLLVVSSPVPSSFRVRRNSLFLSGPRRISFSLDGAISMGGVVLEGCCKHDDKAGMLQMKRPPTFMSFVTFIIK
ncbi:hypothetical protein ILYODFUR_027704 [Ilyodon furcidens]|uniref:Secreted protein n=1 Tax=Ilyodon furcidens TaxID=33524 RepID=A0ABV0TCY7_9TELE